MQPYLFHFFTFWLLLQLNDCDWVRLAGPLDESLTPHLPHAWFDKKIQFQQDCCILKIGSLCHLVVPQILARLLCGALSVPHQAALLIVHLLKMCCVVLSIAWVSKCCSIKPNPPERKRWSKSPAGRPPGSWAHIRFLSCTYTPPPVKHTVKYILCKNWMEDF